MMLVADDTNLFVNAIATVNLSTKKLMIVLVGSLVGLIQLDWVLM